MTESFNNSIIDGGLNEVIVEMGRVINVNTKRWTADVRTETSQSLFLDMQWGNPYLHFSQGEGIYAMPEVGAKCMVCRPSDAPPFIMCFTTTFERNLSASAEESQAERGRQEGQEESNANVSYAAGRPDLQQGDIMLRGRDGNQIWLRRGGVVEIGSTAVSKRIYIPLLNYIRDFCENYSLMTFGGDMSWTVERVENDPAGVAKALFKIAAKESAQDEKATIALQMGEVSDENRFSITVAPDAIDMETLGVDGAAQFELTIDNEGTVTATTKKDVDLTIEGELSQVVKGSASYNYQGGLDVRVSGGDHTTNVSGSHRLTANSSEERLSGTKTITAPSIQLGSSGATEPLVKFTPLLQFLTKHVHPPTGGPPTSVPPINMATRKVTGE